ncbi:MAG: phosphatase PAP2 family protein [Saprospiraceae bacterium]|nr:phosphatase PAP2 family protein [Saprospiraceae bacterium]
MSLKLPFLKKSVLLSIFLLLTMISCKRDEPDLVATKELTSSFENKVVVEWHELLLEIERFTPGYLPPVAARAYGYIGLAAYETVVSGIPGYKSLESHYPGLQLPKIGNTEIHYPLALNSAYTTMAQKLFPTAPAAQVSRILSLQNQLNVLYESDVTPDVYNASIVWGRDIAEAVFEWSRTDLAGHESYLRPRDPNYAPPQGPGLWQPTYPDFGEALLPYWGSVRTFAASSDDKCKAHLPFSTDVKSEFYAQALETENKVDLIRLGQNYEDKWIAQFWSDDCPALTFSPAGRWEAIAVQVLKEEDADLAKAVIVTAKLGMAVCDAGIRCWSEKYRFNLLRPVDYIKGSMGHSDWNSIMCPDGSGQYFTPQFPTYPSGHGTFGAAASEVLTAEFGHDYSFTDKCHELRSEFIGTPRSFNSFYQMAQENAYSRIPIGVHFRMDADAAMDLGLRVGRKVNSLPWR